MKRVRFFVSENKIKLPRKRKKAYIKERGAANYKGMRTSFLPSEGETKFPKVINMSFSESGMPDFPIVSYW